MHVRTTIPHLYAKRLQVGETHYDVDAEGVIRDVSDEHAMQLLCAAGSVFVPHDVLPPDGLGADGEAVDDAGDDEADDDKVLAAHDYPVDQSDDIIDPSAGSAVEPALEPAEEPAPAAPKPLDLGLPPGKLYGRRKRR